MGKITPVVTVDPILLVGATITRASLYNMSYIRELGLDIGATVLISRRNDVIPAVEELVRGTGTIAKAPEFCPACNGAVEIIGENLVCTNTAGCPAQVTGRISNWISELNLLEWGETLIEKIVSVGFVSKVPDLYKLTVAELMSLDRMGEKSARKCHDILWKNTEIPLEIFLGGLSIPLIGQSTIKFIMNAGCDTLDKFMVATAEQFEKVPGVGPIKAKSLANGLVHNKDLIKELLENGVSIKMKTVGVLSGKTISFTGAMVNKRAVLEKMASDAGAEVKNTVGRSCTYLVIADPESTTTKAVAARKVGCKLISEEEFLEMVS